jgi:hypothetical protein
VRRGSRSVGWEVEVWGLDLEARRRERVARVERDERMVEVLRKRWDLRADTGWCVS